MRAAVAAAAIGGERRGARERAGVDNWNYVKKAVVRKDRGSGGGKKGAFVVT